MARAAVASGIGTLVATPHLRPDFPGVVVDEIAGRTAALQARLDEEGIALRLVPGGEVSIVWALEAVEEQLKLASIGQRGTDLLIETPSLNTAGIDHMLYALRAKGYRTILAHPERNPELQRDSVLLERLVEQGVLLQVNADSLLARSRSSGPGALAERLCREGLAHVLAGDAHRGSEWRPVTVLSQAATALAELVGPERARWLTQDGPAAIVLGEPLGNAPTVEPPASPPRRKLFGRR